ncbi:transporter suffix domain-containing protein [Achromobacter aloeverae]|uniref:Transporter suffix domain-containing protein n=1 Tax=Achromobacter aloeverae TaxID=1750518 RepID=A0A4V1MRJ3_9BURK|nr:transporter suffix domain-containing protein [Achromobacter aloeverae]RXN84514.1 hypothetical protein C7R54_24360 [Achromobacter aloeverae]
MTILSDTDTAQEPAATGGWRFKVGIGLFLFAFALWLLVPLAGWLDVPGGRIAALTGVIFIANKVLIITCIAVMGKVGFQQLKAIVFGHAKRLAPVATVGPVRHAIGLVMFFVPLISAMLEPYVDTIWPGLRPNLWQVQAAGDLMLIASLFVLGGNFWNKLHALFVRTA